VEYYDGDGRLVAALEFADTNMYCGNTSFTQLFGSVPTCPTEPIVTDLCGK
jgi:hypothetical protein